MPLNYPINPFKIKIMKLFVLDNYDSFTYNLVHLLHKITGSEVAVGRNDEVSAADLLQFDKIILSPGPGIPDEAGNLKSIITALAASKSILGICLGMQAIAELARGKLMQMHEVMHGKAGWIIPEKPAASIFRNLPDKFMAGRYHSWIVDGKTLPSTLEITARDTEGIPMAVKHKKYDLQGFQFHPESILTPLGEQLLRNWLYPNEEILLVNAGSSKYDTKRLNTLPYNFC